VYLDRPWLYPVCVLLEPNIPAINRSVQNRAKNAHSAREITARRERVGKRDGDDAEADEAKGDE
jgi:hypothetical protein